MHTAMVPEQVKTMKIQDEIQVSRPRELRKQLQLWKRFGRLHLIVFVLVRNIVENGIIELYFVRTKYQLADMFTKSLPEDRFKYLVRRIGDDDAIAFIIDGLEWVESTRIMAGQHVIVLAAIGGSHTLFSPPVLKNLSPTVLEPQLLHFSILGYAAKALTK
nr:retrovirus-related Pol polyprotein from transposon TNT 1-94 [Tanacetum cinerariifolium]